MNCFTLTLKLPSNEKYWLRKLKTMIFYAGVTKIQEYLEKFKLNLKKLSPKSPFRPPSIAAPPFSFQTSSRLMRKSFNYRLVCK